MERNVKIDSDCNIYSARMLVRHAADGKKYLYDLLKIKKEMSSPLES